ncbi:MAG TPA: hydrogenase expression protein HupH, partial [Thermoanaerobacterales bacterium]|nr:hydrogenase expression protein HupH [Thermoanaerobacterales bacterium]
NCFADPGISAAREICDIPVAGPGESAMALALLLGHKFSIISVKKNVVSMFEIKARAIGLTKKLASIEYINISVSELERDRTKTVNEVVKSIEKAVKEKCAEVIILGCTGMLLI